NRVLMPLLNEAMYAVMEGVATPEAVDEVFKLGMAHPMGPLTLADFIGLDVCLDIMRDAGRAGRSKVPAVSAADQDGGCGVAGEKERERILQVLGIASSEYLVPSETGAASMTSDTISPRRKSDVACYVLAALAGMGTGWVD